MKESTLSPTAGRRRALADQYAAMRLELSALHAQPIQDLVAIDSCMKTIDALQMELKAMSSTTEDPQRF